MSGYLLEIAAIKEAKRLEKNRKRLLAYHGKTKIPQTRLFDALQAKKSASREKRKGKEISINPNEGILLLTYVILNYYIIYALYSKKNQNSKGSDLFGQ